MGILHKLVFILAQTRPAQRASGKQRQIDRVKDAIKAAEQIEDSTLPRAVDWRIWNSKSPDIEDAFERNELDYGRKLYPDRELHLRRGHPTHRRPDRQASLLHLSRRGPKDRTTTSRNRGIRPLPNLETKFVAANTLIGVHRPGQQLLRNREIDAKEAELRRVRERHFLARTPATKAKYREQDEKLRAEIAELLKKDRWDTDIAKKLASWDPYDQNASADFFDPEWMFSQIEGFDITIGNPPYVRADEQSEWNQRQRWQILASKEYETLWEKWDLFVPFIERAYKLLKTGGISTLIVSDAYCHSKYAQKSQKWFLQNARIRRLDFCSDVQIFDAAVHNLIYFFQKADGTHHRPERQIHRKEFGFTSFLPTDEQAKLTHRVFFPEETQSRLFSIVTVNLSEVCYISVGMVVHADEKVAQGAFELDELVSKMRDELHPKPFVEGKYLDRWLPNRIRWLEWGTERAPRLFRRPTFPELYTVPEKLISVDMSAGVGKLRVAYDDRQLFHNHSAWSFVPWHLLAGVRNNSLKKSARYRGEKPPKPDLPKREELEQLSKRFAVKYVLGVMNSSVARDFLRANRRSNIHLYPDDWKKLPIPDVEAKAQAPIVALVDQILIAKRADIDADVSAIEAKIEQGIRTLYGMTQSDSAMLESCLDKRPGVDEVQRFSQ